MLEILQKLIDRAGSVRKALEDCGEQLVLAESCTAGMVASALAHWPGISKWLCGSMVVYQSATKETWLGINQAYLEDPAIGPVSREVTDELSQSVLARTPQATLAAAVTGHLGPGAPPELDGVIFIALSRRSEMVGETDSQAPSHVVMQYQLRLPPLQLGEKESEFKIVQARQARMLLAADQVLECILKSLVAKRSTQ